MTDKPPRAAVGTAALKDLERTKARLVERLRLRVEAEEVAQEGGRALVFASPSRPIGMPIAVDGVYWMRARFSSTGYSILWHGRW